jgi:hypothetical protein
MPAETYQTARDYEEPYAVQFSVFMPNRVGQFRDLLNVLGEKEIRVIGVSVVDSTDWSVIRMIFDNPNHARELLHEHGYKFTESEVLLIELQSDDSLREICAHLLCGEINVHFAYPLTIRSHSYPVMVFHVDDTVLATQILTRRNFTLLGSEDLADPT